MILLEEIELMVYDFDGVMTNNKVYVDEHGRETVQVNRADGLGVSYLKKYGIRQIIISTETNPVVKRRAEKLEITCFHGIPDKTIKLKTYCRVENINLENVIYIGNDINDLDVMKIVGWPICPADAHPDIKSLSKLITKAKGGEGVIREISDLIAREISEIRQGMPILAKHG